MTTLPKEDAAPPGDGKDGHDPDDRAPWPRYISGEAHGKLESFDGEDADAVLLQAELAYIAEAKPGDHHVKALIGRSCAGESGEEPQRPYMTGLALSGGGIRSATFSLGVMQRLAGAGILRHIDYLSTVSGGGYIGSALSWWLSGRAGNPEDERFGVLKDNFPFGTRDPEDADSDSKILNYLRRNGRYLTPGNGVTIWSGLAVILRATVLNLLVWIPVFALVFLIFKYLGLGLHHVMGTLWGEKYAEHLADPLPGVSFGDAPRLFHVFLVCAAYALAGWFLISSINYSLMAWVTPAEAVVETPAFVTKILNGLRRIHKWIRWFLIGGSFLAGGVGLAAWGYSVSWDIPILIGIVAVCGVLGRRHLVRLAGGVRKMASSRFLRWPKIAAAIVIYAAFAVVMYTEFAKEILASIGSYNKLDVDGNSIVLGKLWGIGLAVPLAVLVGYFIAGGISKRNNWGVRDRLGLLLVVGLLLSLYLLDGFLVYLYAEYLAISSVSGKELETGRIERAMEFYGEVSVWISIVLHTVFAISLVILFNFWVTYYVRKLYYGPDMAGKYGSRRMFEMSFGNIWILIVFFLVLGTIPIVADHVVVQLTGGAGLLAGAVSATWGHIQSRKSEGTGVTTSVIMIGGSIMMIYGILLFSYVLSNFLGEHRFYLIVVLVVAVLTGSFTDINYISLHRFYRDRLMEAFMPNYGTVESGSAGPATRADDMKISDLWRAQAVGPYHLINTNLVLVNAQIRKYRTRGGDSFIFSTLYSGSNATGWQRTEDFNHGYMTLASAMATSGAAANPRAGAIGKGATTNRFVSLVMTLFNLRLGLYVRRPSENRGKYNRPTHFYPGGLFAIPGMGYGGRESYLELSDGGHFENLAFYELVRRRCGLIIVCDGGQDNKSSYADFVSALQRIQEDFGAKIILEKGYGPEMLIPRPREKAYPREAEYADQGYFVATIDYGARGEDWPGPKTGTIVYMKTCMIDDLSMTAKGYKGANPTFPDQSTADQFFSEEQFEAYREVGYRVASQMIDDLGLESACRDKRPDWSDVEPGALLRRAKAKSDERRTAFTVGPEERRAEGSDLAAGAVSITSSGRMTIGSDQHATANMIQTS